MTENSILIFTGIIIIGGVGVVLTTIFEVNQIAGWLFVGAFMLMAFAFVFMA